MRNRALHDALREFALEAAALLTDELKAGAELEFDVVDEGQRRGPALYRYRPKTAEFIAERWDRLCELPTCARAAEALGEGAAAYLQVQGLPGVQAQPALQAMLERLYEDATGFGFPEERFERVYREVEATLFQDALKVTVLAPLRGVVLEPACVELGGGLTLRRTEAADAPPEASLGDTALCVLEQWVAPDDRSLEIEARGRFRRLVTGMRLWKEGAVSLCPLGWRRAGEGRWQPLELGDTGVSRGAPWVLATGEDEPFRDFLDAIDAAPRAGTVDWALARFEMGCSRATAEEALSDYLLALRSLLDATTDTGRASLPLRVAALCAEEGARRAVQRRVELSLAQETFVMSGRPAPEPPEGLVEELEGHLRALLRDVLCGYLEPDLRGGADEILLERPEQMEIEARDLRERPETEPEPEAEPDPDPDPETEPEPDPEPKARIIDQETEEFAAVTSSIDWDEDPGSYSAPV
jgi:hypothetical protein